MCVCEYVQVLGGEVRSAVAHFNLKLTLYHTWLPGLSTKGEDNVTIT